MKINRYSIGLLCVLLVSSVAAEPTSWTGLRDGRLHLRPQADDGLRISWQPAWATDANREQLYLLDRRGQLIEQLNIAADQLSGSQTMTLSAAGGDYQLSIPGYSFRHYRVSHGAGTASLFEPAKVHFSAETRGGQVLYFQVAAGQQAVLAGKHHGGVSQLQATRLSDSQQVRLPLRQYPHYIDFDQLALPVSAQDEVWRLQLTGSGKAAFWLDGTANLFAPQASQLYTPVAAEGNVQLRLGTQTRGLTPRLGVAMPYVRPPASAYSLIDRFGIQAANRYTFVDVLNRDPQREFAIRELYATRFGITHDITLLAGTGRRAVLQANAETFSGLRNWVADTQRLPPGGLHYLAFADEPNLNYPDYPTFERYFTHMLDYLQSMPGTREAGIRVALPASSRWLDGAFQTQAAQRRGIDWARRLLSKHGDRVDAVAWHEWMVRELLATRRYRDSVQQAAQLVGLDAAGRPNKALLLSQTNISSGSSLSVYQQNTHFAALWWASVVINASHSGLLDMLNWFHAVDEPEYPKGWLAQQPTGELRAKPVGLAQQFIQQYWLPEVLELDNSAFEVDVLAMRDAQRFSLLGVNKAQRQQQVNLAQAGDLCAQGAELLIFGDGSQVQPAAIKCTDGQVQFALPSETVFVLHWEDDQ